MPFTDHFKKKNNRAAPKFWGRVPCVDVASMVNFYNYTNVKKMMYKLKYQGYREVGYYLGLMMGRRAKESKFFNDIDMIVPIPLHKKKLVKRGYNQSLEISKGVSEIMEIPIRQNLVIKHTHTKSQTKMGRIERVRNVYSSFSLSGDTDIENRHILIIDDVLTTGATIEACANHLLTIPKVKISIMTACIARN